MRGVPRALDDGALPTAIVWRILPGAPRSAFLIDGQRLFISCEGGDVVLHDDGTIRLAVDELAPSTSGR